MQTFAILATTLTLWFLLYKLILRPWYRRQRVIKNMGLCRPYTIPTLPAEFDRTIAVSSHSKADQIYSINLHALRCNCRRYTQYRGLFPAGDIHRLCRHQRRQLVELNLLDYYDELTRCIIQSGIRDRCYRAITIGNCQTILGYHPRNPFLRLYMHTFQEGDPAKGPFSGPCQKYVFNTAQESWIYGDLPPMEEEVIATITRFREQVQKAHKEHTAI
ncbi:hypothetical protein Mmc1_0716 [Magnetococcus marinus MC-1]|uniref:Uncharacterized protein n=1 Tax=Magnetococcus marinus (strain ATCC BAA-1437 / JCM 17883 / MC-1) TaxID=156889 RepID=A0L5J4_MAGMM|nr:hypothetical protein [Magnetococcus marinus]ABK43237.1 hypothetical protein Mmc1_0716 [Magnetococcus marinus MC-1]